MPDSTLQHLYSFLVLPRHRVEVGEAPPAPDIPRRRAACSQVPDEDPAPIARGLLHRQDLHCEVRRGAGGPLSCRADGHRGPERRMQPALQLGPFLPGRCPGRRQGLCLFQRGLVLRLLPQCALKGRVRLPQPLAARQRQRELPHEEGSHSRRLLLLCLGLIGCREACDLELPILAPNLQALPWVIAQHADRLLEESPRTRDLGWTLVGAVPSLQREALQPEFGSRRRCTGLRVQLVQLLKVASAGGQPPLVLEPLEPEIFGQRNLDRGLFSRQAEAVQVRSFTQRTNERNMQLAVEGFDLQVLLQLS
mmetsp:Transcript_20577/g.71157  ORF Transcript_20577/g.71157 Transcript_20577/m.71157 type:complete len:308 (-) Transcript_20577:252-1175(-)